MIVTFGTVTTKHVFENFGGNCPVVNPVTCI